MIMQKILLSLGLLAAASGAAAKIITRPVAYEHAGVKLEGYLAYDDTKASATGKAPGSRTRCSQEPGLRAATTSTAKAMASSE